MDLSGRFVSYGYTEGIRIVFFVRLEFSDRFLCPGSSGAGNKRGKHMVYGLEQMLTVPVVGVGE